MTRIPLLLLSLLAASSALAQQADLRVVPELFLDGKARIGDIVPMHVRVVNDGPDEARNARATVSVAPGMFIVQAEVTPPFAAACDASGTSITCSFGNLPAVDRLIRLNVRVPAEVGTFPIASTITSDTTDPNPANNSAVTTVETENRSQLWVYLTPAFARVDPGDAVKIEARLTNHPATLAGNRFTLRIAAQNGTIESIDAAPWQCTIAGATAECVLDAPASFCCVDHPLQITVRTNDDPAGGETRLAIDPESEAPFDVFGPAEAIIETHRHVVVTSTADAGPGSLRAAFEDVNANCATRACKIDFALPGPVPPEGWFTIVPETPLPAIHAQRVTLDATTQTARTGDTNPRGPEVAIDGRNAGEGLELHANCHAVVRGLALGNFHASQALWMTQDRQVCTSFPLQFEDLVEIADNHIGVDPTGTVPWPNLRGLRLDDAGGVRVTRNVISRNVRSGVWMWRGSASFFENTIQHNGASGIFVGPEVDYAAVQSNAIDWNTHMGVAIARGAGRVRVRANSMIWNVGLGIDWGLDGRSPANEDDRATEPNAPALLSAVYDAAANETLVTMTLRSAPVATNFNGWLIDLYANGGPDGDGEQFLRTHELEAVPQGAFTVKVPGNHEGKWISATNTRVQWIVFARSGQPRTDAFNNVGDMTTSEFSNAVKVVR
ncbi:MAG TPA: right-handed parallel beta-helix repeat-containing protein [Thermoanaerobaculia bacterium]